MEQKNELLRNIVQEERRQELDSYQRALDVQWMNNRMEDGRIGRCLDLIEREAQNRRDIQEVEQGQANQVMLNALYNDMEENERQEEERLEQTTQYSRDLQQHLLNKQHQKQCKYEDTLKDRKRQEQIMRNIADEDQRDWQYKRDETEKMYDEMVTGQHDREVHKQKQKEMVVIEDRKIEEQQQFASDRSSAVVADREKKMHDREEQINRMGQKTFADENARQERKDSMQLLQEQEYQERGAHDGEAAQHRQDAFREEARQDRATQLQRRQQDARALHEEDARYQRQADAQLMREDGIEVEKERVKREKNHQYGEDLRKQIEENARRRKAEKELDQQEARNQWEHDATWRAEEAHKREEIAEPELKHDDMIFDHSGVQNDEELVELDIDTLSVSDCTHGDPKCDAQCRKLEEY